MSTPTKCDLIRAGAAATIGGACTGKTPPADCYVTDLASKKDMYFQTKYGPAGFVSAIARDIRGKELGILRGDIDDDVARLQRKYGAGVPADITWTDFGECLWKTDGSPGGPHGNRYFGRDDLTSLGYQPQPVLGGAALEGRLPAALTGRAPVWLDRLLNPALAIIVVFVLLVLIFAVLMYDAHKRSKGAPAREAAAKKAWRAKMEVHDPYRGTAFESYPTDPDAKWKGLISTYEAQGYCMENYRKKLGMPVTDHCEAK